MYGHRLDNHAVVRLGPAAVGAHGDQAKQNT
jgi:hypothetical protein